MNLKGVGQCRQQGAADVSSAVLFPDASAGKMPAAPWSFVEGLHFFLKCTWTMNVRTAR
jgi:hypothetical protein